MTLKSLTYAEVKAAIIASLTPDLLEKKWLAFIAAGDPPESGHCAVATEAFYYLAGGREAGYMPVVCGYDADDNGNMYFGAARGTRAEAHPETHWWTRGPAGGARGKGEIFDVTAGQYPAPFPYQHGHNTGFMQPQRIPSRRAQTVMNRVAEKLGAAALANFRDGNIARFQAAVKQDILAACRDQTTAAQKSPSSRTGSGSGKRIIPTA